MTAREAIAEMKEAWLNLTPVRKAWAAAIEAELDAKEAEVLELRARFHTGEQVVRHYVDGGYRKPCANCGWPPPAFEKLPTPGGTDAGE